MQDHDREPESSILSFKAACQLYGISIQNTFNPYVAVSSFSNKGKSNFFHILQHNQEENTLRLKATQDNLKYPLSKIIFSSDKSNPNLLATSDIQINLYKIQQDVDSLSHNDKTESKGNTDIQIQELEKLVIDCEENSNPAPLTSINWNKDNPSFLAASSIDTTCSIWDINKRELITRLIAHDKEVYDIAFLSGEHVFLSTGADGSVRLFDRRDLDSSQIVFESNDLSALTRIAICNIDCNYFTALTTDKNYFYLVDLRDTTSPVEIINKHENIVNAVCWSAEDSLFCSVSDDRFAYVWDLKDINLQEPYMEFNNAVPEPNESNKLDHLMDLKEIKEGQEINNVDWGDGWIGINSYDTLKLLKI